MRQIIHFQAGECGNQIGMRFWHAVLQEHQIDVAGAYRGDNDQELQLIDVCFRQETGGRYRPRAILFDLAEGGVGAVKQSHCGNLFASENCITGQNSAHFNWAVGYYSDGADIIERVLEAARRQVEHCESLEGLQLTHSLGGGTGAGAGSLLVERLKDGYPGRVNSTFSVVPNPRTSQNPALEWYNCALSLHCLVEKADAVVTIDYAALYGICNRTLRLPTPVHSDMNHIVAQTMSGVTSIYRFPNRLHNSLRRMTAGMTPFPRLHFLVAGFAPIRARGSCYRSLTVPEVYQQVFDSKSMLIDSDVRHGRYLTVNVTFRGDLSGEQENETKFWASRFNSSYFAEWIPNNVQTAVCRVPQHGHRRSAALLGNNTVVKETFQKVLGQYSRLLTNRILLHRLTEEGVEEQELAEAQESLRSMISEYQQYQDMTLEDQFEEEMEGY